MKHWITCHSHPYLFQNTAGQPVQEGEINHSAASTIAKRACINQLSLSENTLERDSGTRGHSSVEVFAAPSIQFTLTSELSTSRSNRFACLMLTVGGEKSVRVASAVKEF